ncbi:MAG: hypothetical protein HQK75_19260, partial [Candidatus Magnetomorum sp.]|nr:hypothetical protein [Candidatus Magnetomorum sp.]
GPAPTRTLVRFWYLLKNIIDVINQLIRQNPKDSRWALSKKPSADNDEKKESKNGHGKNGIDQFTGADIIEIPHPTLKNGDLCPECPNGKVYKLSPGVF